MPAELTVREAHPGDDAGITEVMSTVVMPGSIDMTYHYGQSFFSALEVEGYNPKAIVAELDGKIVGAGAITTRKVYIYGNPTEIGYLSSLRLLEEYRGSSAVARGYRLFKEIHMAELKLPLYLTSIMRSNTSARGTLTSGKGNLPRYQFVAGYKTAVIPAFRKYMPIKGISIIRGDEAGMDAVFSCFEQYGRTKDFFTVYDREDWLNGKGMLKGMHPEDFIVATKGSELLGVVALWNQSTFKQLIVSNYAGSMRILNMLDAFIGKLTGSPALPAMDKPFAPVHLSCVAIKDNDPEVFHALLIAALNLARERKTKLLAVGLFENDRLGKVVDSYFHLPVFSDIYSVGWDATELYTTNPETERYLDGGSL